MSFPPQVIVIQKWEVKRPRITSKFSLGVQNEAGKKLKNYVKSTQWS